MSSQNIHLEEKARVRWSSVQIVKNRLWPYVRVYRNLFLVSCILILASTFVSTLPPWILGKTVDLVIVPKNPDLIFTAVLVFLSVIFAQGLLTVIQTYSLTKLGQRVLHDLRQDLLRKYEFYPIAEFNKTPTGRLVTRLVNDTSNLQDLFTSGLAVSLRNVLTVLVIMVWLVVLHPVLGLTCISILPLIFITTRVFGKKIRQGFRNARTALSRLNSNLAENISGMWVIQLFNREELMKRKLIARSKRYTKIQTLSIQTFAYFQPAITLLSSFSMALLIWVGGYQILYSKNTVFGFEVTLGLLIAFMSYLQAIYAPIRDVTEKFNLFLSAISSCEQIFEFMDRPSERGTKPTVVEVPRLEWNGDLSFNNLWFKYAEDLPWVLKDFSTTIKSGEKIGIVGPTGSGKTTITSLLLRFYDPTRGSLLLNGEDLLRIDKRSVRQAIAYVQQEPFLFSGTIADNLFLWDKKRLDVFNRLPEIVREPFFSKNFSLEKLVVEKGANLSAGERQILAFVRALCQEPDLLILDEATAHVDTLTEQWFLKASKQVFEEKTVIIIAHRLATLKQVDRILVLKNGVLLESGNHQELLQKGGLYSKLYQIQAKREKVAREDKTK